MNTQITLTLNITNKTCVMTGLPGLRENVNVALINTGTLVADNLVLGLIDHGVLLASIPAGSFSGVGPTGINGNMNLNTQEMVDLFTPDIGRTMRRVVIAIWDVAASALICNSTIEVVNNPYNSSMDPPVSVPPIGGGNIFYVALADYQAHVHQTGDGGSLDPYYIRRVTPGANFRVSTDGLNLEFYDPYLQTWDAWGPVNGSWSKL